MKKLLLVIALVAVSFFGVTNVNAMSESELRAKIKSSYKINGKKVTVPAEYIKLVDDYLATYKVSSKDCDTIANQLDKIIDNAKDKKITSFDTLMEKYSSNIKSAFSKITKKTGVKITMSTDGKVTVYKYNSDEVFAIVENGVVTNTGSASLLYIAGIISLLGVVLFAKKVREA